MKRIIIIGNGLAGLTAAKKIRSLDKEIPVTIFSKEKFSYYLRPGLIDYLAGKIKQEKLHPYNIDWYGKNNFDLQLNTSVNLINPKEKYIAANTQKYYYDKLIIATGAKPFLPPITGIEQKGVFVLRTLEDALKIKEYTYKEAVVIGGGLLGIEVAAALAGDVKKAKVIDIAAYPLAKQLTVDQGQKLLQLLAVRNITFFAGEICESISFHNQQLEISTKKETKISGDLIIVSAGVKASIDFVKNSGLNTDKGIQVNEYLQTSDPDIYAAGDCIQLNDQLWGFVKSAMEQGQIAAENALLGNRQIYSGTTIDPILKVSGIKLGEL